MPGYKKLCRYRDRLIAPESNVCPLCGKVNPMGSPRCPRCRNPVQVDWVSCGNCGTPLQLSACPRCGTENQPGMRFCGECGNKLS